MKMIDCMRYDLPRFLKNLRTYRKDLWNTYPFDIHGGLRLLRTNIQVTADTIEKYGNEIEDSRLKKIAKMRRAVEILNHHIDGDFVSLAELQLGKKLSNVVSFKRDEANQKVIKVIYAVTEQEEKNDAEIYDLARKIEKETWRELFDILHGRNYNEYEKYLEKFTDEEKKRVDHWYEWFDGSGMLGWWD
jgi:hypothetical protein